MAKQKEETIIQKVGLMIFCVLLFSLLWSEVILFFIVYFIVGILVLMTLYEHGYKTSIKEKIEVFILWMPIVLYGLAKDLITRK